MSELAAQFDGDATTGPDPVALTDTLKVLIGPLDVQAYDRFAVYAQNAGGGGAAAVDSLTLQSAPTDAGPWTDVPTADALAPLVNGASAVANYSQKALKYVRLVGKCAAGLNTSVKAWFSAGGIE